MRVLEKILASKRAEIGARAPCDHAPVEAQPIDIARALRRGAGPGARAPLRLLAEVKQKSPSAGVLSCALSPEARAVAYAQAGASLVSVLCDAPFFDGSFEHVAAARRALDSSGLHVPLLAKEFVVDAVQLEWARAHGADAVLLIARIVPPLLLVQLVRKARWLSLEPLVEVADEAELEAALAADARVIGVNVRDLDTLAMDTERAARVLAAIPADRVAVHLSGVRTPEDVGKLAGSRADAALVGEALMRVDDPGPLLRAMVARAGAAN
jgi:indole-3-glycerol phosphate synthase